MTAHGHDRVANDLASEHAALERRGVQRRVQLLQERDDDKDAVEAAQRGEAHLRGSAPWPGIKKSS